MSDNAILYSALAILGLPLLSYALTFFFGKKLPRKGDWVGVGLMGIAEALAIRDLLKFEFFFAPTDEFVDQMIDRTRNFDLRVDILVLAQHRQPCPVKDGLDVGEATRPGSSDFVRPV